MRTNGLSVRREDHMDTVVFAVRYKFLATFVLSEWKHATLGI